MEEAEEGELTVDFHPSKFLEQVPAVDNTGCEVPAWKRGLLAKQLATKAQREAEHRKKVCSTPIIY